MVKIGGRGKTRGRRIGATHSAFSFPSPPRFSSWRRGCFLAGVREKEELKSMRRTN